VQPITGEEQLSNSAEAKLAPLSCKPAPLSCTIVLHHCPAPLSCEPVMLVGSTGSLIVPFPADSRLSNSWFKDLSESLGEQVLESSVLGMAQQAPMSSCHCTHVILSLVLICIPFAICMSLTDDAEEGRVRLMTLLLGKLAAG
jgi:hypothetical protein